MPMWRLLSIIVASGVLLVVVEMMRRRKLREKYAGIWLILGVGVVMFGVVPGLAAFFADLTGIQLAANFLFALSVFVLMVVVLQLSSEVGHLEEEVRTTVEEIALLRCDLEDLRRSVEERRSDAGWKVAADEADVAVNPQPTTGR
jgi:hypothetical protein